MPIARYSAFSRNASVAGSGPPWRDVNALNGDAIVDGRVCGIVHGNARVRVGRVNRRAPIRIVNARQYTVIPTRVQKGLILELHDGDICERDAAAVDDDGPRARLADCDILERDERARVCAAVDDEALVANVVDGTVAKDDAAERRRRVKARERDGAPRRVPEGAVVKQEIVDDAVLRVEADRELIHRIVLKYAVAHDDAFHDLGRRPGLKVDAALAACPRAARKDAARHSQSVDAAHGERVPEVCRQVQVEQRYVDAALVDRDCGMLHATCRTASSVCTLGVNGCTSRRVAPGGMSDVVYCTSHAATHLASSPNAQRRGSELLIRRAEDVVMHNHVVEHNLRPAGEGAVWCFPVRTLLLISTHDIIGILSINDITNIDNIPRNLFPLGLSNDGAPTKPPAGPAVRARYLLGVPDAESTQFPVARRNVVPVIFALRISRDESAFPLHASLFSGTKTPMEYLRVLTSSCANNRQSSKLLICTAVPIRLFACPVPFECRWCGAACHLIRSIQSTDHSDAACGANCR